MSARHTSDNFRQDYRPLVLLVWALLVSLLHVVGLFPYKTHDRFQPSEEKQHFAWLQSNAGFEDGLYHFSDAVELEQFYRQNNVYSSLVTNKSEFDVRAITSSKYELKEKSKLSPTIAPFFFLPVSVNEASVEVLGTLPGIGKNLAERIVVRRQSSGRFQRIDDLLDVEGIGVKKLNKLRPLISLE
jgi:competence ComEA-like helix-hairpin-helix protein